MMIVFNRNGSIVVQYKLYYQYDEILIINEKVYQDFKDFLMDIDFSFVNLLDFVIIKVSVNFFVEVQILIQFRVNLDIRFSVVID